MSTGDQSQYIRGKIAQRGLERGAHFMEDGFDRWAESTAPARAGQMEKMGAEPMAQSYGGAMSLKQAKKLHGGFISVPPEVQRAIDQAKQLAAMWKTVSKFLDDLKNELNDEVINNEKRDESYKKVARNLIAVLNSLKPLQSVLDAAVSFTGAGRSLRGGATFIENVTAAANKIYQAYMWLKSNKGVIEGLLELNVLQPVGRQVLSAISPIFSAIGMGKKCCGGALPVYDVNAGKMEPSRRGGMGLLEKMQQQGMMQPDFFKQKGGNKLMDASPLGQAEAMKAITGMGRKVGGKAPSARGEIVKKVMREQGLSLPQASKYVKEHGLYGAKSGGLRGYDTSVYNPFTA